MGPDFVNVYIEKILKEVGELTKVKLLLEARLEYTEKLNASLSERIKQLEGTAEKQSKKKQKEVDTSLEQF